MNRGEVMRAMGECWDILSGLHRQYLMVYRTGDRPHLRRRFRRAIECILEREGIVERVQVEGYEVLILTRRGRKIVGEMVSLFK